MPSTPLPTPNNEAFDTIRHDIEARTDDLRGAHPGEDVLSISERQDVFRVASQGVLRQLEEAGVKGADSLSGKLTAAAGTDGFADLFSVADRLRQAEAMATELGDVNAQAEHHRLALLADAVGGTAAAVVGSVLSPEAAGSVVARGRSMLEEYQGRSASVKAVRGVLGSLLDRAQPEGSGPDSGPEPAADTSNVIKLNPAARRANPGLPSTPRIA